MTSPVLSILTPTWNRADLLPRLFESIAGQGASVAQVEWIVVDDGSTDETRSLLAKLSADAAFRIMALHTANGGKHRAVNRGVKVALSKWLLIVDSDDWLLPDALDRILAQIARFDDDPQTRAVISPREIKNLDGTSRNGNFRLSENPVDFAEWQSNNAVGDSSMLFRRTVIAEHPFPEYEGERFIPESSAFSVMFREGGVRLSNDRIVAGEYLPDGLSARSLRLRAQNTLGALHTYHCHLKSHLGWQLHLRNLLNYHRFYWHAIKRGKPRAMLPGRPLRAMLPLGWMLYLRDARQLGKDT